LPRDDAEDDGDYDGQLKARYKSFKADMVKGDRIHALAAHLVYRLIYAFDYANDPNMKLVELGSPMRQGRPLWTLASIAALLGTGQITADQRMALTTQFEKVAHFFAQRTEADRAHTEFLRCFQSLPPEEWDETVDPGDGREAFIVENIPLLRLWQDLSGTNLWVGMGHVYGLVNLASLPMYPTPFIPYVSDPTHTAMRLSVVQHGLSLAFGFAGVQIQLRLTAHADRSMCHTSTA
jgi:hypothetical protein